MREFPEPGESDHSDGFLALADRTGLRHASHCSDLRRFAHQVTSVALGGLVIDSVTFANRAFALIPHPTAALTRMRREASRRIHYRMSLECAAAGFAAAARRHQLAACLIDPTLVLRAASRQSLLGPPGMRLRAVLPEVLPLWRALSARGVDFCVTGSMALSLHAGHLVKRPTDVDLDVGSDNDFAEAIAVALTSGFREIARHRWSEHGLEMQTASLLSPTGLVVELGDLPNARVHETGFLTVMNTPVPVVALTGLRDNYLHFMNHWALKGVRRWSSKHAVLAIDTLLGSAPTLSAAPTTRSWEDSPAAIIDPPERTRPPTPQ